VIFSLSSGEAVNAPESRKRLYNWVACLLFHQKATEKKPWKYDKRAYKLRNEVERIFRRIKRFRRVFTRYDKLVRHKSANDRKKIERSF
jgi:transposase